MLSGYFVIECAGIGDDTDRPRGRDVARVRGATKLPVGATERSMTSRATSCPRYDDSLPSGVNDGWCMLLGVRDKSEMMATCSPTVVVGRGKSKSG